MLAYCLGLIHESIRTFALSEGAWCHKVCGMFILPRTRADYSQFPTFCGLFSETGTALSQLNHLGMGLDSEKFRDGCGAVLPLCDGLYLSSSIVPQIRADRTPAIYT